jgi:hypothetical protein
MKIIIIIFCLLIFPISFTMGEIYTHKDKDGTIHIYDQLNGPNFKTKDLQGTNENKSKETEPQLKNSAPRKVFEQETASQQTDRDLCLSNSSYKSKIETLRSQILSSEEKIETLHSQNRSQKEQIESFNSQILNSGERNVTPLNLYPEEKAKQINSPIFNKVIGEEKETLDKHSQELSRYQKKYSEIQQEIKRRNIDCTRED